MKRLGDKISFEVRLNRFSPVNGRYRYYLGTYHFRMHRRTEERVYYRFRGAEWRN